MDLMELIFILLGAAICVYYGWKLLLFSRMLFPKRCFPLSETFFTSMGDWAVVTGASEGIGRAYAFALAERGMNVVIMSRTKATLDLLAKEIGEATGQKVKVIVADFSCDNTFREIEEQLMDLNIGVLVNNVGVLPSIIPCKFLDTEKLEKTITMVINCNVKTMMKMCKVFVERFSRCLQAEYESKGIIIQAVVPFGVSTRMAGYQKTNMVTLSPEDFVKTSMQYLRAGDKTHGSICHTALGWLMQCIPLKVLHSEFLLQHMQYYVKKKMTKKQLMSAKTAPSENGKH
uniref:Hydroxysteroid (17-beta) dehydrogenase 3 n=1 Tax=Nothobranchius kadleci TaxID=1051664 RepID=A0A1A8C002_NOTKA